MSGSGYGAEESKEDVSPTLADADAGASSHSGGCFANPSVYGRSLGLEASEHDRYGPLGLHDKPNDPLRLAAMTFNTSNVPFGHGHEPDDEALDAICDRLSMKIASESASNVVVIALQESNMTKGDLLIERIARHKQYHVAHLSRLAGVGELGIRGLRIGVLTRALGGCKVEKPRGRRFELGKGTHVVDVRVGGYRLTFATSHLPFHAGDGADQGLKARVTSMEASAPLVVSHEHPKDLIIWMGDLNFRRQASGGDDDRKFDQLDHFLRAGADTGTVLDFFEEFDRTFATTCKLSKVRERGQTGPGAFVMSRKGTERTPSHCDRILYSRHSGPWITDEEYGRVDVSTASDHAAVTLLLTLHSDAPDQLDRWLRKSEELHYFNHDIVEESTIVHEPRDDSRIDPAAWALGVSEEVNEKDKDQIEKDLHRVVRFIPLKGDLEEKTRLAWWFFASSSVHGRSYSQTDSRVLFALMEGLKHSTVKDVLDNRDVLNKLYRVYNRICRSINVTNGQIMSDLCDGVASYMFCIDPQKTLDMVGGLKQGDWQGMLHGFTELNFVRDEHNAPPKLLFHCIDSIVCSGRRGNAWILKLLALHAYRLYFRLPKDASQWVETVMLAKSNGSIEFDPTVKNFLLWLHPSQQEISTLREQFKKWMSNKDQAKHATAEQRQLEDWAEHDVECSAAAGAHEAELARLRQRRAALNRTIVRLADWLGLQISSLDDFSDQMIRAFSEAAASESSDVGSESQSMVGRSDARDTSYGAASSPEWLLPSGEDDERSANEESSVGTFFSTHAGSAADEGAETGAASSSVVESAETDAASSSAGDNSTESQTGSADESTEPGAAAAAKPDSSAASSSGSVDSTESQTGSADESTEPGAAAAAKPDSGTASRVDLGAPSSPTSSSDDDGKSESGSTIPLKEPISPNVASEARLREQVRSLKAIIGKGTDPENVVRVDRIENILDDGVAAAEGYGLLPSSF